MVAGNYYIGTEKSEDTESHKSLKLLILRYYFNWQYLEIFHSEELLLKLEYSENKDLLSLFRLSDFCVIVFETILHEPTLKYPWVLTSR